MDVPAVIGHAEDLPTLPIWDACAGKTAQASSFSQFFCEPGHDDLPDRSLWRDRAGWMALDDDQGPVFHVTASQSTVCR